MEERETKMIVGTIAELRKWLKGRKALVEHFAYEPKQGTCHFIGYVETTHERAVEQFRSIQDRFNYRLRIQVDGPQYIKLHFEVV